MKAPASNPTLPSPKPGAPGVTPGLYLEIESQDHKSFRLPVHVEDLAAEGVILEVAGLPSALQGDSLFHQEGIIHLVPDGFTKETRLRSQVVWIRQVEPGSSRYLLGMDLGEADFRAQRCLQNLISRPKDISDLWTYWDQVQTKPAGNNGIIIFYVGVGVFLGGLGLKVALPDSYNPLAMGLTLSGLYLIAGKCLWNWWQGRSLSREN